MKRVLLYLGMGSCVSAGDQIRSDGPNSSIKVIKFSPVSSKSNTESPPLIMEKTAISAQTPVSETTGSKEETFFDSKAWLDSDDDDFVSVNGESSPVKQVINNGDHQGRKLSELFLESSFGRDSKTSVKANAEAIDKDQKLTTTKLERKCSGRSAQRCLPSLVRSLSCGDRKKRLRTAHVAVVG